MDFKTPLILFSIPFVIGFLFTWRRGQRTSTFFFPSVHLVRNVGTSLRTQFQHLPFMLRLITLTLFLIALAGPRLVLQETSRKTEGIDIVLAIDSSGSMAGEDFVLEGRRVNRLDVVKNVVAEFIKKRSNDRIGLVTFAGVAYTVTPLTTDYSWLTENLNRIELGLIEKDGTAIGSGILTALARLKKSEAKSKVIILLTDGVNNEVNIDPMAAAKAAKAFGVKIYTIGAGSKGYVPFPVTDFFGRKAYQNVIVDIDEGLLTDIADTTGGKYFRATDTASLRNIYGEIDQLEKTEIKELGYFEYKELFVWFLLLALGFLVLEIVLSHTILLKIP